MAGRIPVPREHGAWGLLLQPFLAAILLARNGHWLLLPALALILLCFIIREPLLVLARQRWVWRKPKGQSAVARRWIFIELAGVGLSFLILTAHVPIPYLVVLAGVVVLLTLVAVWCSVRNLQRSVLFQTVIAAGLGSTALLAALVVTGELPAWAWLLWLVLSLHSSATILVVHARLRARAALRLHADAKAHGIVYAAQGIQVVAGIAVLAVTSAATYAIPLLFSASVNTIELLRLSTGRGLTESLTSVGYRTLAISLIHTGFTVAALWTLAGA